MSQGGVTQPAPVGLQAQLGVLQRVAAVLVQQLTALGQTAEVRQGQVAQNQLDELWMEDGEKEDKVMERKGNKKETGETKHKTVLSVRRTQHKPKSGRPSRE